MLLFYYLISQITQNWLQSFCSFILFQSFLNMQEVLAIYLCPGIFKTYIKLIENIFICSRCEVVAVLLFYSRHF